MEVAQPCHMVNVEIAAVRNRIVGISELAEFGKPRLRLAPEVSPVTVSLVSR